VYGASTWDSSYKASSLSSFHPADELDQSYSISGVSRVKNQFLSFLPFVLNCSQLRSEWLPAYEACMLPNMEHDKLTFIIMFVTDVVLVFIMFLGLIRMRGRGGGMFGLGTLLWRQVRPW
jgi:hypothetical protein